MSSHKTLKPDFRSQPGLLLHQALEVGTRDWGFQGARYALIKEYSGSVIEDISGFIGFMTRGFIYPFNKEYSLNHIRHPNTI